MFEINDDSDGDIAVSPEDLNSVNLFKDIDPEQATPEQVKQIIQTGKTLLVQKKGWRTKAQAAVVPQEPAKPSPTNQTPPADPDTGTVERLSRLELSEEKRQFGYANSLSPEETDHVFAFAKGTGVKPSEALSKPFIKSAIETMRQESRNSGATPGPSSRSPMVDGKSFSEMKTDDKRKNFSKVVSALQKK